MQLEQFKCEVCPYKKLKGMSWNLSTEKLPNEIGWYLCKRRSGEYSIEYYLGNSEAWQGIIKNAVVAWVAIPYYPYNYEYDDESEGENDEQ